MDKDFWLILVKRIIKILVTKIKEISWSDEKRCPIKLCVSYGTRQGKLHEFIQSENSFL
jgi:hypothetical protein